MPEETEMDAMRQAFKNPSPAPIVTPVVEQQVETTTPIVEEEVKTEAAVAPIVQTEIKEEIPVTAPIIEIPSVATPEVKIKTFDEEFSEKFDGKYKSVDEIKAALNTPKEEFADENIKHWNDLVKKGVKLDREFFELQSLDVDNMDDPTEVLLETMKRKDETKGLSDRTLQLQLNKKYNLEEWIDKDDVDLTEDDLANREIMVRDAQNDKRWLKEFKKERTLVKPVDETVIAQQRDEAIARQQSFEKVVDEIAAKAKSLSTIIDIDGTKKETFEYKIPEADSKEFVGVMKLLTKDVGVLFNQFTEKDGQGNPQINHQKVLEMFYKNRNYEPAIRAAFKEGMAYGAKTEIKEIKNINFTQPDGRTADDSTPKTEKEAMQQEMKKRGVKVY